MVGKYGLSVDKSRIVSCFQWVVGRWWVVVLSEVNVLVDFQVYPMRLFHGRYGLFVTSVITLFHVSSIVLNGPNKPCIFLGTIRIVMMNWKCL